MYACIRCIGIVHTIIIIEYVFTCHRQIDLENLVKVLGMNGFEFIRRTGRHSTAEDRAAFVFTLKVIDSIRV